LHDLVPAATLIGFLVNPRNPITERNVRDALDAAQKLGEKIEIVHASSEAEIDAAFDRLRGMRASALLVQPDAFLNNERIVALAARNALPTMYQARELVAAGGLMSYGSSLADMYRQMGVYVGKVLKGANPAEMPVLQPVKFEMAINLQTAKALGLKLSDNLLSLADEVRFATAKQLFVEHKIDAFLALPPDPQDLRARKIGHVIVDSALDRPWSQHFCCVFVATKEFVRKYPAATKRVLRAILKATDFCASNPAAVARQLVDGGFTGNYDYALQTLKEVWYNKWREYDIEDSVRFYSLRLREAGMIKSAPNKIIADGTNWRFLNELKRELKS
jgi:ABC transporter substrate binding protein/NMT1-like family